MKAGCRTPGLKKRKEGGREGGERVESMEKRRRDEQEGQQERREVKGARKRLHKVIKCG